MASGDVSIRRVSEENLPVGHVVTASGRVSGVHQVGTVNPDLSPFATDELIQLDEALIEATRRTRVRFNVLVGDLGADPAAGADAALVATPEAEHSVLIAVSPNQHAIEVRYGRGVAHKVDDRIAQLGITAATGSFRDGDLIDGLVAAVRVMSAAITGPSS
ncbi:hypothetical protein ASG56_15935 [Rhodococcus sp. Leaf7]|uniref:DUF5130 family protein n=1 Tax=unclassified Rhodococcus (in: high G+C Gram-positive bacteria) TaxID=192944 RepID=UPI0005AD1958|nr:MULTISPECIES: DUF5130 family protein [unclassified Rhodococcus (in: high G+C Gram-positive bacteria)]KIQ20347.1 hypothetical protein RU01_01545 [Rhodococcus sp. MEB064]KQU02463.1 hypothetical protein ASG56_15935 [Rhodococcus sp. Leaf7]KQU37934.1 hypothetical protein ASG64_18665 [Rhodococcus sp. Leaf247]